MTLAPIDVAPYVPSLTIDLPEGVRFGGELQALGPRLRAEALAGFGATFKTIYAPKGKPPRGAAGRKDALDVFELEVGRLRGGLLAYVDARISEPVAERMFALVVPDPVLPRRPWQRASLGLPGRMAARAWPRLVGDLGIPAFRDFASPRLLGKGVAIVERFEAAATPRLTSFALTTRSGSAEARATYETWLRLVRLSVAATVTSALPYAEIWVGVYGNAGWKLAEQVVELAAELRRSPAFAELAAERAQQRWIDRYVSFDPASAVRGAFPVGAVLEQAGHGAHDWLTRCARGECDQEEEGVKYPSGGFPKIPLELYGDPALETPGAATDHLFARQRASDRVAILKAVWDLVRGKILEIAPAAHQRMTAGSLEHGGGHPPHDSHRNGAMFDFVPGERGAFPLPEREGPELWYGPEERPSSSGSRSIKEIQAGLAAELFVLDEGEGKGKADMEPVGPDRWYFRAPDLETPHGRVSWEQVSICYTQAIILSFPSQILFASWAVLFEAWEDLRGRVAVQIAHRHALGLDASDEEGAALAYLKGRLAGVAPVQWPGRQGWGGPGRIRICPRPDHANHWHVSYRVSDVERDDAARDAALEWLRGHAHELWLRPAEETESEESDGEQAEG